MKMVKKWFSRLRSSSLAFPDSFPAWVIFLDPWKSLYDHLGWDLYFTTNFNFSFTLTWICTMDHYWWWEAGFQLCLRSFTISKQESRDSCRCAVLRGSHRTSKVLNLAARDFYHLRLLIFLWTRTFQIHLIWTVFYIGHSRRRCPPPTLCVMGKCMQATVRQLYKSPWFHNTSIRKCTAVHSLDTLFGIPCKY